MPRGTPRPPGYRRADQPKTYDSWRAARRRCEDPNHKDFPRYGGRGIRFLFEDYAVFLDTMGPKPEDRTIDRIDVDGHYEPSNCRWADAKTQRHNQRRMKGANA